jgi:crossover junction endodeoxyribonuclease RuvC
MRVLGIDPGLSRCGYGCVEATAAGGRDARAVAIGVIRTPIDAPIPHRLAELQRELRALIADLQPDAVAVEKVFFQSNVRTAIGVAQASGLALAEAVNAGAVVAEYTPNQVKEAVAGWGAAAKEEVGKMVQALLRLDVPLRPADAADAAALALCHLAHAPRLARVAAANGGRR